MRVLYKWSPRGSSEQEPPAAPAVSIDTAAVAPPTSQGKPPAADGKGSPAQESSSAPAAAVAAAKPQWTFSRRVTMATEPPPPPQKPRRLTSPAAVVRRPLATEVPGPPDGAAAAAVADVVEHSPRRREASPPATPLPVPCVAHPTYTGHKNCGCVLSVPLRRSTSPPDPPRSLSEQPSHAAAAPKPNLATGCPPPRGAAAPAPPAAKGAVTGSSPSQKPAARLPPPVTQPPLPNAQQPVTRLPPPVVTQPPPSAAAPPPPPSFIPLQRLTKVPFPAKLVVPMAITPADFNVIVSEAGGDVVRCSAFTGERLLDEAPVMSLLTEAGMHSSTHPKSNRVTGLQYLANYNELWVGFLDGAVCVFDATQLALPAAPRSGPGRKLASQAAGSGRSPSPNSRSSQTNAASAASGRSPSPNIANSDAAPDGSALSSTTALLHHSVRHAGAVTAILGTTDGSVLTASVDWKILRWIRRTVSDDRVKDATGAAATPQLQFRALPFGGHSLGVRCLQESFPHYITADAARRLKGAAAAEGAPRSSDDDADDSSPADDVPTEPDLLDSSVVVSGGDDHTIRFWSLSYANSRASLQHASAAASGAGEVWSAPTPLAIGRGHSEAVLCAVHVPSVDFSSPRSQGKKTASSGSAAAMPPLLWTAGDDTTIRRWLVQYVMPPLADGPMTPRRRRRRQKLLVTTYGAPLCDHTAGVHSMQFITPNVWSLGKNGLAIMYHAADGVPVHKAGFGLSPAADTALSGRHASGTPPTGTSGGTTATTGSHLALLHYVMPVAGHIVWVTDAAGQTSSWFAPNAKRLLTQEETDAALANKTKQQIIAVGNDGEKIAELEGKLDACTQWFADVTDERVNRVVEFVDSACQSVSATVADAMVQMQAELDRMENERRRSLQNTVEEAATDGSVVRTVYLEDPEQARTIAELEAELKDALETIEAMQRADAERNASLDKMSALAQQTVEALSKRDAELQCALSDAARWRDRAGELDQSLKALQDATASADATDALVLQWQGAEQRYLAAIQELKSKLSERNDSLANANAALEEERRKNAALEALLAELQESDASRGETLRQLRAERDQNARDAARLHALLDQTLLEKEDALAKLATIDVDHIKLSTELGAENASLKRQVSALMDEINSVLSDLEKMKEALESRNNEVMRLSSQHKDRDATELQVRLSYEARIAELVARLHDLELLMNRQGDLSADNEDLRKKLSDFVSPKYQDLLNENVELKRQLMMHKQHITRLIDNEAALERIIEALRREITDLKRLLRQSRSPRGTGDAGNGGDADEHNPNNPHHRANCLWCSGKINISAGTTFATIKARHDALMGLASPHSRSATAAAGGRSISVSSQQAVGQPADRSVSPMTAVTAKSSAGSRRPRSPNAVSADAGGTNAATGGGGPQADAAEKRLAQLETLRDAVSSQQVRTQLVEEILALHRALNLGGHPS